MTAVETHSPEWHAERASGIGGSDIPSLLGLTRYGSPFSLWAEKTGLIPPDPELATSERLQFGREMEPVLAAMFHRRTGLHVVGEQMMVRHPVHTFARATLDGLVTEHPGDIVAVDDALGTVQFKTWATFGFPDGLPPAMRAQTIWEAGVAGLDHAWCGVLFAGFRFEVFELEWDRDVEQDWQFMLERAAEFWALVENGTPPPVDDSDATADAIAALWPEQNPDTVLDADPTLAEMLARRTAIKARVTADEQVVKQLTNEIAALVGDHETIAINGAPAFTYRAQSKRTVDAKALKSAHPELDLEPYTNTSTFRVLRAVAAKKEKK